MIVEKWVREKRQILKLTYNKKILMKEKERETMIGNERMKNDKCVNILDKRKLYILNSFFNYGFLVYVTNIFLTLPIT